MTYLLFFLSIGLATTLALIIKQLQQQKNDHTVDQQKLKEAGRRLQEADRKYGGLISREDTARELDKKIIILTDRLKQLDNQAQTEEQEISVKISVLKANLQGLEEQEIVEAFGFYESKYDFQEAEGYKQRLDKIRAEQKQMIKDKQAAVCHTEWSVGGSAKEGKR
jgi:esterase/lipase superfamily enzyme